MVEIIRLSDDSIEFINNGHDLVELFNKHLGYEAAQVVKALVDQADYTTRRIQSDLASYESSLESMSSSMSDIADIASQLKKELHADRLNRKTLISLVDRIESEISNHV